jgi:hypothetical protein
LYYKRDINCKEDIKILGNKIKKRNKDSYNREDVFGSYNEPNRRV